MFKHLIEEESNHQKNPIKDKVLYHLVKIKLFQNLVYTNHVKQLFFGSWNKKCFILQIYKFLLLTYKVFCFFLFHIAQYLWIRDQTLYYQFHLIVWSYFYWKNRESFHYNEVNFFSWIIITLILCSYESQDFYYELIRNFNFKNKLLFEYKDCHLNL